MEKLKLSRELEMKLRELRELHAALREQMFHDWNRDLPLEELLFDRFERARALHFGEGTSIYHNSYVYGDVKIGKHSWVGPFTLLDGTGGLEIGDYCSISAGVQIYTHDTVKWALSGGKAEYERAPVKVGNRCYIGANAVVSKGVVIEDCCVIGASAFVNRNLPSLSVAVGVPCRIVGRVEFDAEGNVKIRFLNR